MGGREQTGTVGRGEIYKELPDYERAKEFAALFDRFGGERRTGELWGLEADN